MKLKKIKVYLTFNPSTLNVLDRKLNFIPNNFTRTEYIEDIVREYLGLDSLLRQDKRNLSREPKCTYVKRCFHCNDVLIGDHIRYCIKCRTRFSISELDAMNGYADE